MSFDVTRNSDGFDRLAFETARSYKLRIVNWNRVCPNQLQRASVADQHVVIWRHESFQGRVRFAIRPKRDHLSPVVTVHLVDHLLPG